NSQCNMTGLKCGFGNVECFCSGGNWNCSGNVPQCPQNPHSPGSNCTGTNLQCTWGGLSCVCFQNDWFCN
nr:hypothetical protein [Polyangiaceae bacterium]